MTALLDNLINPMSQWYRDSSIRAFMQWWSGELIRMVPEKYRDSIFPEAQAVYINQGDREKPMLWRYQNNQFTPLDEDTDLQNDEWWHRINHFIAESEVNISTTYLLSNQYAIVRNVTLPQAAMGEIDSVLAYELDKYVPFRADEAVFAWRQGPVDDGSEKVLILLAVIKKDILDNILQAINSKGVKLSGIDINVGSDEAPQPLGVNLLPVEMRKKRTGLNGNYTVDWVWHCCCCCLLLCLIRWIISAVKLKTSMNRLNYSEKTRVVPNCWKIS